MLLFSYNPHPCLSIAFSSFFLFNNMLLCLYLHVYVCSLPYLYLDLHVYSQIYVPILRSMCLCAPCHVGVLRSICQLLCHLLLSPFCSLMSLFLVFWPLLVGCRSRSRGLGIHSHTQAYIKGFRLFPYMHVYVFLLLCFMSMLTSLDLGFAMLCAPRGLVLVWLNPSASWLIRV